MSFGLVRFEPNQTTHNTAAKRYELYRYFFCTVPVSYEDQDASALTGTAVHIPYSQSSAGGIRVQLFYRISLVTVTGSVWDSHFSYSFDSHHSQVPRLHREQKFGGIRIITVLY